MTIEGYFRTGWNILPAPHVQAFVQIPRLALQTSIDFLIDTGADHTSLHPGDITKLSIDYRRFKGRHQISADGIGGSLGYYPESAHLIFRDNSGGLRRWQVAVYICSRNANSVVQDLPSLLGRDFLSLCVFRMDKSNNLIQLDPLRVDSHGLILPS